MDAAERDLFATILRGLTWVHLELTPAGPR
jgi:hypothetical protein